MDPLVVLPAEIALRILDFTSIASLSCLTRLNHAWHTFIDDQHQDAIYSSPSKIWNRIEGQSLSSLNNSQSFARYFDDTASWKDLCKRQHLLHQNWTRTQPVTRESIIQVGNAAVWRFAPDFVRRIIVSTSQQGGLYVTDMDTGQIVWQLPREHVPPYAHLEYQDGRAVWNNNRDTLEVWETDLPNLVRGEFKRCSVLSPEFAMRGFKLLDKTLCVVGEDGKAVIYDLTSETPDSRIFTIEQGAAGHVFQDEDTVVICMGNKGYHFYYKASGDLRGIIHPQDIEDLKHINHPVTEMNSIVSTGNALDFLPGVQVFPPRNPTKDRLTPIELSDGWLPQNPHAFPEPLPDDIWGAAVLSGSLFVGISKAGRILVCTDWRLCLADPKKFQELSYIIEIEGDDENFDLGGWLAVRDNRIMVEVLERIYVISLGPDGRWHAPGTPDHRPSFAFNSSSAMQLKVPVSFMALGFDCIMSTYTTLGWHRGIPDEIATNAQAEPVNGIFPTKTIRVISLAPSLDGNEDGPSNRGAWAMTEEERHAHILSIMDMLSDDDDEDDEDIDEDDSNDDIDDHGVIAWQGPPQLESANDV